MKKAEMLVQYKREADARDRLIAINADLLAALKELIDVEPLLTKAAREMFAAEFNQARAAIDKATQP